MVEHQIVALRVAGSIPVDHPLIYFNAPVAQLDRAFASGAKGYRFKSCQAHEFSAVLRP